jgi:hypothetical protein
MQAFQKSWSVFCSVLLLPLVAYFLEPSIFISLLPFNKALLLMPFWLFLGIILILQVCFYSGAMGSLIDIVSEEETLLSWDGIKKNIKLLWKETAVLFILPHIILFFYFTNFSPQQTAFELNKALLHSGLLFVMALIAVRKKYHHVIQGKFAYHYMVIPCVVGFCLLNILFAQATIFSEIPSLWILLNKFFVFFMFLFITCLLLDRNSSISCSFMREKELILINPSGGSFLIEVLSWLDRSYPPIFVVLRALTPKTYYFREYNRIAWHNRYLKENCLVAITCYTSNSAEAYKIAKEFRKKGAKVIMGGPHVTFLPHEALEYCDSVVLGEVEGVWSQVLQDYENNCLKPTYDEGRVEDYYRITHQELLNDSPHLIKDFLETTRGCKFKCNFCTIPLLAPGKVRKKPVAEIVELIQKAKGKYFIFLDNNIYNDPVHARELFEALIPLKIKWHSFSTIDIAKNDALLALAKKSGCFMLVFGYEIFSNSIEKDQRGKLAMAERYLEYTRKIQKAGIHVKANFMFGFDSDHWKTLIDIWKFCFKLNPLMSTFGIVTPFPGTKLYQNMVDENRMANLNWRKYAVLDLVFRHPFLNTGILSNLFFPYIMLPFFFTTCKLGHIFCLSVLGWLLCLKIF